MIPFLIILGILFGPPVVAGFIYWFFTRERMDP